jgi:hypothetical protein
VIQRTPQIPILTSKTFTAKATDSQLWKSFFGQAGGTVPVKPEAGHLGQVFVYAVFTDNGIWVTNAH